MSLISRGMAMLRRVLGDTTHGAGVGVTLARQGESSAAATVWVGRTAFRQVGAGQTGAGVIWGDRDYLIPVENFPAWNVRTPQRGDQFTESIGGVPTVFEVRSPGGEPAWRYADPARTFFRVHTIRVGAGS